MNSGSQKEKHFSEREQKNFLTFWFARWQFLEQQQKIPLMKLFSATTESEVRGVKRFLCVCVQEMKDQLSSPSAVAQAEKKNRQVGGCFLSTHTIHALHWQLEMHDGNYGIVINAWHPVKRLLSIS